MSVGEVCMKESKRPPSAVPQVASIQNTCLKSQLPSGSRGRKDPHPHPHPNHPPPPPSSHPPPPPPTSHTPPPPGLTGGSKKLECRRRVRPPGQKMCRFISGPRLLCGCYSTRARDRILRGEDPVRGGSYRPPPPPPPRAVALKNGDCHRLCRQLAIMTF